MDSLERTWRSLTDAACKEFLGDRLILACILKDCVPEFQDCALHDIENKYIEGEPEIGTVGVYPETTNTTNTNSSGHIRGMNAESASDTEGRITFDIRFYALTPANERVKLIINIEAQNEFYPGYPLMKRAVYYGCRLISSQYGVEFDHAHYENIKKVYSIWICFDPPIGRRNTITIYQISEKQIQGNVHEKPENYDLMAVVMICLGSSGDERYKGVLKVLDVFMSQENIETKQAALQSEFNAKMPQRLLEKEIKMCNYSDFIANRGRKAGRAEDLSNLMKKLKMTVEQALDTLSIPESEWDDYRALLREMETKAAQ